MNEPRDSIQREFEVTAADGERRLDQVVSDWLPEHSRSRIQGWIKSGALTLNGQKAKPRDKVHLADKVRIEAIIEGEERWEPQAIELDVVYEDEHLLVINKPVGLVVHPAAGHADGTLVNALLHHAPTLDHIPRAGVVHRLDKETSGIMVVAKSLIAHTSLVEQLQERTMGREYEAIVTGTLTGGGTVDAQIGRHPQQRKKMAVVETGKPAVTHYRLLERFSGHSYIRCKLETGRTHQIRVHMAHIRHPLVGDPVYGGRPRFPSGTTEELRSALRQFRRQALHARQLTLVHPESGEEMSWETPLPSDFEDLLEALRAFERQR
ncbi:23S rRNA pseudouridine(1911/1915/1917) synthase RluD [Marinobacteraceae bacterium S3BR75-40.1]